MILIELAPEELVISPNKNGQWNYIYDHLKLHLARVHQFPAASARVSGSDLIVTHGAEFVRVALELGLQSMMVFVLNRPDEFPPLIRAATVVENSERFLRQSMPGFWGRGLHTFVFKPNQVRDLVPAMEFFQRSYAELLLPLATAESESLFHWELVEEHCVHVDVTTPFGDYTASAIWRQIIAQVNHACEIISYNGLPWSS